MPPQKTYRRFIRVGNDIVPSPRFKKKSDADSWYDQMKVKKQFSSSGLIVPNRPNDGFKFIDFARDWMKKRMKNYGPATWQADEQRLRDYILPYLSEIIISKIDPRMIKDLLLKITEEENKSIATRTRVKALLSKMFSDAFNSDLIRFNPVTGIKFDEKRVGQAKPVHIASTDECIKFLKSAKELSQLHLTACSIVIMAGLRKSEVLALTWDDIDFKRHIINVSKRLIQTTMTIEDGTKGGTKETRVVPYSDDLNEILKSWKEVSKPGFVFQDFTGRFMGPRQFYDLIIEVSEKSGVRTHVHGLRHTYGRSFAENSGNMKALQAILGHASSATTDLYSELSGDRLKGFGEAVKFGVKLSK